MLNIFRREINPMSVNNGLNESRSSCLLSWSTTRCPSDKRHCWGQQTTSQGQADDNLFSRPTCSSWEHDKFYYSTVDTTRRGAFEQCLESSLAFLVRTFVFALPIRHHCLIAIKNFGVYPENEWLLFSPPLSRSDKHKRVYCRVYRVRQCYSSIT